MGRAAWMAVSTAVLTAALIFTLTPSAAFAHGGPGSIEVLTTEPVGGSVVHVEVGITYVNDGEPANRATVSVTGTGPDGAVVVETAMGPGDTAGRYLADVPVTGPGPWTLTVSSAFPPATAEVTVEVPADATSTGGSSVPVSVDVVDPTTAPSAVTATTGTGPTDDSAGGTSAMPDASGTDDGTGGPWTWVAVSLVVAAAAGLAIWRTTRK